MIDFNITVVVQAFHFLIAWWVLSRFLFKPLVKAVQSEQSQKKRLNTLLENEQELLEKIQHEQQNEWRRYCKQFQKKVPELRSHLVVLGTEIAKEPLQMPTPSQTKKMITAASDSLVRRITHE